MCPRFTPSALTPPFPPPAGGGFAAAAGFAGFFFEEVFFAAGALDRGDFEVFLRVAMEPKGSG